MEMISTKGRYAIRVMLDIAENSDSEYVPLKDIAARQDISKKYLEIIGRDLVKGGFVRAASGKGGGYTLTKNPDEYKLSEILNYMEGSLAPVACLKPDADVCPRADVCKTLPMWKEYYEHTLSYFDEKTLADLL